ncbi:MAG: two component transcriptional regulator, LuxR family [Actinomycetia bacterium]|nr:two component transcriptional regulator, LuxR family [Actinomycetes bacterium]
MLSGFTGRVRVVGQAGTARAATRLVTTLRPDIVLLDVRLGPDSGLDLCRALTASAPDSRVVFLSVYDDEQYVFEALRAGASGYLLKRVDGLELVRRLEEVVRGETVIEPTLAGRMAASAARLNRGEFWPGANRGLTQRESEVLSLLVAGLSNRAIAGRLVLSEETVKSHLRGLYRKLEVSDRSAATALALREGLFR